MFYKLYQNNNDKTAAYKKWYARAVVTAVKDINDIADEMQKNCTVKKSDIKAVLNELPDVLMLFFEAGYRVCIEGLGSFKVAVTSAGTESVSQFNAAEHIKRLRIIFQPETEKDASTGKMTKKLLRQLTKRSIDDLASAEAVKAKEQQSQEEP